jgi:hypothetical protein
MSQKQRHYDKDEFIDHMLARNSSVPLSVKEESQAHKHNLIYVTVTEHKEVVFIQKRNLTSPGLAKTSLLSIYTPELVLGVLLPTPSVDPWGQGIEPRVDSPLHEGVVGSGGIAPLIL